MWKTTHDEEKKNHQAGKQQTNYEKGKIKVYGRLIK